MNVKFDEQESKMIVRRAYFNRELHRDHSFPEIGVYFCLHPKLPKDVRRQDQVVIVRPLLRRSVVTDLKN